ncbi:MAG: hypothetical protein ACLGHN_02050 [Bacteriovoracia bacterium]
MRFIFIYLLLLTQAYALEQRDVVSFQRGPYVQAFYNNFRTPWSHQAAIHAAHGAAHDMSLVIEPEKRSERDREFEERMIELTLSGSSKNGPRSETYGPLTSQFAYDLFRTIDWTHVHHEQTYDIMSYDKIKPEEKRAWTKRAEDFYLKNFDLPRSIAPLEVTMRRAGVMMKPYFTHFRNYFPRTNSFFWVAHWWHPAIYEAQYLGMKDGSQKEKVKATDALLKEFFKTPPQRMILSRELMPRYTEENPETANIFDNLHMLHGIAYDILTYPHWSKEEKSKEINRVIKAMSYKKGDEKYVRAFKIKHPHTDPTKKEDWMISQEGAMNEIMKDMMNEMAPMMMPNLSEKQKEAVKKQFMMKLGPFMEEGEHDGSLHDALMKIVPDMKMNKEAMGPGKTPTKMIEVMLKKWEEKNEF